MLRLAFGPATACELTVLALSGFTIGRDHRPIECVQKSILRLVKRGYVAGRIVGNHPVYELTPRVYRDSVLTEEGVV